MTRMHAWGLGVLTLSLYLATGASAQIEEEVLGVSTELEKAYKSGTLNTVFQNSSPGKKEQADLEKAAQYLVWRVTWIDTLPHPEKVALAVKEFDREYQARTGKAQAEPVKYFNAKLVESFKAIFERKFENNRVSTINAAQMLPMMAKGKSPELGKYLVELVKDQTKHDAVKLYAVKALQEYNAIRPFVGGPTEVRKKEVLAPDVERVNTLIGFIERKPPEEASPAQLEAFAFLRREAVRSLAHYQVPAVIAQKADVDGAIAVPLLRVLSKNPKSQFAPEPGIAEKCEAMLGLANMRVNDVPEFIPQFSVYAVSHALAEFINAYRADFANFNGGKKVPQLAWGSSADRLKQALSAQVTSTKDTPAAAMSAELYKSSVILLDSIKNLRQVDNRLAIDFQNSLKTMKNPGKHPFKNNKKIEVDLD